MRLPFGGLLVAGTVLLGQTSAGAADTKTPFPSCTTTPTEADRKAAQGAFAAGQGSFNEADYTTAITYWRDAYKRDCTAHALLLNLARAYELRGDRTEAVNALETYLQRKPDDSNAEQIKRRIENLKTQIAAAAAPPPPAVVATPVAPPPPSATEAPLPIGEAATPKKREVLGPLLVGGAGLVVVLIGGGLYSTGTKKVNEAEAACPDHKCPAGDPLAPANLELGNQGGRQQNQGGALIGVGLAAVAGGVVWYLLSGNSGQSATLVRPYPSTALVPALGPGYAGVALSGGF